MRSDEAAYTPADSSVLDGGSAGPMVARLVLGERLRRLREERCVSRVAAGHVIRASRSKISRLEGGRHGVKPRDVADLLTHYGVTDEAERATLLTLAEQANAPAWWQYYADVVPAWTQVCLGVEQAASLIRCFEVQRVPHLLQTPDYARASIRLAHPDAGAEEVDRRCALRMTRGRILHRRPAAQLWAVIDEAALRRPVGGLDVMRDQLRHLIEICRLPHVTVQIMPFLAGGHAAESGPVTILRLPGGLLPDVVYLEQLATALYPDKPSEIERYWDVMNRLVVEAESPDETPTILHRILQET
ncbi:helix-turn-helix domain-containing protein [Streptomyces viridochromogenes]|uniref:helix-turn-helix domain-containing protein n=1 Tax=Streptomyces viridochromogenes TaxID=1938 RepID=UPI00069E591A|nr:helix-turn-helix transcriptional regulator [Streptomyces viridochromogenes]KOG10019.1 XRE family transcriptional regulator [Streptomyces viridochromogenes]KOG20880.1 XRE family transcriptional regulator [Streptomyces viridochromogenes]